MKNTYKGDNGGNSPKKDSTECGVFTARLDHLCQEEPSIDVPPEAKFIFIISNNPRISVVHLNLKSASLSGRGKLSSRELEVLRSVYDGKTHREISDELYISIRTVRQHIQNIKNKLGACTGAQAVGIALTLGLFDDLKAAEHDLELARV